MATPPPASPGSDASRQGGSDADAESNAASDDQQQAGGAKGDNPEQLLEEIKTLRTQCLSLQGEVKALEHDAKLGREFLTAATKLAGDVDSWKQDPLAALVASASLKAVGGDAQIDAAAAEHAKQKADALRNPPKGVKGDDEWMKTFHDGAVPVEEADLDAVDQCRVTCVLQHFADFVLHICFLS